MAEHNTIAEMRTILDAIEQGKEVQFRLIDGRNEWVKFVLKTPDFCSYRYRVKPEEPEKKWRPFKDADEFIQAIGGLGTCWFRRKSDGQLQLLTVIERKDKDVPIRLAGWMSFNTLLFDYTFADGTPCGVLEEV